MGCRTGLKVFGDVAEGLGEVPEAVSEASGFGGRGERVWRKGLQRGS